MKKLRFFAFILLLSFALITSAYAAPIEGEYTINRISESEKNGIKQSVEKYKKSDSYKIIKEDIDSGSTFISGTSLNKNEKKNVSIKWEDSIIQYLIPFKYGEIWSKTNKISDLLKMSEKRFFCPVMVNDICCGECSFGITPEGKIGASMGIMGKPIDWMDPIFKSEALDELKKTIGTDKIDDIVYMQQTSNQGSFIYFSTPKGEYIYPFSVPEVEDKKLIKLQDFLDKRVKYEVEIAKPENNYDKDGNLLVGGDVNTQASNINRAIASKPNKFLIAGVSAGAAVVVALIGFALWLFVFRKRKHA